MDDRLTIFLSHMVSTDYMVSIHENAVAIPGERLGSLEQFSPGNGTYVRHGFVYASLAGYRQLQEQQNGEVC